jgi:hypothetical protein
MTRADFTNAIDRYCQRLVRSNVNPHRGAQIRSGLHGFLRKIERDMQHHPDLFENPAWGVPSGPGYLERNIAAVARLLAPDVVRIRYNFGEDHSGDPALFVRVLLSDKAAADVRSGPQDGPQDVTENTADKIRVALVASGVKHYPYFNFRGESEQRQMKCKDWE